MFRDHSLMPKEAIRLAALGFLADGPAPYGELASAVRHFTTRYWGPTLDVMASSIELLRFEGLIEGGDDRTAPLHLTDAGRAELHELLSATVRAHESDFNKLVVALKLRFLHLLPRDDQHEQLDILIEMREAQLARLADLRASVGDDDTYFRRWLDHDIAQVEADLAWFAALKDEIDGA